MNLSPSRFLRLTFSLVIGVRPLAAGELRDVLLPNGEPVVGVYYYPWFHGEPYQHVGWTPEFEYDNVSNDAHIRAVLKAITDYGINHAAFSYWDNSGSLEILRRTFDQNRSLFEAGRKLFLSPYLEPPTLDERYGEAEAQQRNVDFIATYLQAFGQEPSFAQLGDRKFTNIYVAYYQPTGTDEEFQAFLAEKYATVEALNAAWQSQYAAWEEVTLAEAKPGTVRFVDVQEWRVKRLREGWEAIRAGVKERTGFDTAYTGDNSETLVGLTEYLRALTGLTWYSFGQAIGSPFMRPKIVSEVAKYTDTTFLYTISPGYVDRQQRWPGARIERDPFLYPYAWVQALSTLPEGIMILTHSEWFEGSIIDVTKEYGKQAYETTELYSSLFRAGFADLYRRKRTPKPLAVVYNEYVPFRLHERGAGQEDTFGLIQALDCLSQEFDVIPEPFLTPEELQAREVVFVPNCGHALTPGKNEVLYEWLANHENKRLFLTVSRWWAERLGFTLSEEPFDFSEFRFRDQTLPDRSENLNLLDVGGTGQVLLWGPGRTPLVVRVAFANGSAAIFLNLRFGREFYEAFFEAAAEGQTPTAWLRFLEDLLRSQWAGYRRPSGSDEIKQAPPFAAGKTLLVPAANVIPWGYLVEHRPVGGGLEGGHSAEDTVPWTRERVDFTVELARAGLDPAAPIAEVLAVDSDSGRFQPVPFRVREGQLQFTFPLKFHAVFAAVQSPVRLTLKPVTIHLGETLTVPVELENLTERPVAEGTLRLRAAPGLTMEPGRFALNPREKATVALTLHADRTYATGNRTIVLEVEVEGEKALFWRPLTCRLGPMLATRTTRVGGWAGETTKAEVVVVNVGEAAAENLTFSLLGKETTLSHLGAGEEATVSLEVAAPELPQPERTPAVEVSTTLGSTPETQGLQPLAIQEGDGIPQVVTQAGVEAWIPDAARSTPEASVRFLYFRVEEAVLPPGDYHLEATLEYFDEGLGSFYLEYDATPGEDLESRYRDSASVPLSDTKQWKSVRLELPHARLGKRQNYGADLRINGVVAIRKLTLRTIPEPPPRTMEAELTARYEAFGEVREEQLPLQVVSLRREEPRPAGLPESAVPIYVIHPYDGETGPPARLQVDLNGTVLEELHQGSLAVVDETGRRVFHSITRGQPKLCFTAPWRGPVSVFYVHDGADEPPASDLKVNDFTAWEDGFLAVENDDLALLWDAAKAGTLVSFKNKRTGADYAAFPAGAFVVEYDTAEGKTVVVNEGSAKLAVERAPGELVVRSRFENEDLAVADTWRVGAHESTLRLDREITFRRDFTCADFRPLSVRFDPAALDRVLPLGVGFQTDEGQKRGWLETWALADGYFAYRGTPTAAHEAAGFALLTPEPFRRIRYGFQGEELQLWLRAKKKAFVAGETLRLTVLPFAGTGLGFKYPRQLKWLAEYPPFVLVGDAPAQFPAVQTPRPQAPAYMFEVRRPGW